MDYGYVRVSTKDQNELRQMVALRRFGIQEGNIFMDKQSGKDFNRKAYKALLRRLKRNDVMVVKSIDRLGRNYDEIIDQWRYITKTKLANIVVIDKPLLDTRSSGRNLMGIFISDIVLQILSYVAETERENIRQRQREGIDAAKEKGKVFGRPKIERPKDFDLIHAQWQQGIISSREAGRRLRVSQSTFLRWCELFSGEEIV
ncbi:MAG: recombinase family protein [Eubacterium sp.]|nr:recombinase family protein [Eubacterium sp.]